ncbi:MAG: aspartyl/asparaginyl beta-hydroxylase domain-containing protein [Calditrichaeota bacterium]|nr:MAG: aspartyl/asparaginyl beta-hydroxylase domain-containing protein [Calditrichota bacterium]
MSIIQAASEVRKKLVFKIGFKILQWFERVIARHSLIGDSPFFPSSQFEWSKLLEENWPVIRREAETILQYRSQLPSFHEISPHQKRISDEKWKTFFLYGYGYKSEKNCQLCPNTTRLLEKIPGMKTAFFSILEPHKHIPDHRGPYKGLIRYHLGVIVPEPKELCRIRVGQEYANWEEGKSLVFDDTYNHEVWNDTDGERVVLFLDVIRPMPFPISWLNALVIKLVGLTSYIQDAKKNQEKWEKKLNHKEAGVAA